MKWNSTSWKVRSTERITGFSAGSILHTDILLPRTYNWAGTGRSSSSLSVNYEQKKQKALIAQTESKSNNWVLMANISARLGKGWTLSADGSYMGDIETLYSLTKKYYTVNSRITKEFNNFSLYLEGRDLFDTPIVTEFFSQDLSVRWIEESHLNRRLFLLGFTWKF